MGDKDSIKTLIGMFALSAPPTREADGATGAHVIAARVPLTALIIFKMKVRHQFSQTMPGNLMRTWQAGTMTTSLT
jgi:hypothetical protein